jgi:malate dehydrogenase (oxaloacetate-decarboxylating)
VSRGNLLSPEAVNKMGDRPIVFALANPDPEISLADIKKTKAYIYATGRSDYPNQINNVLAFPGIFRGALDAGYKKITERMCVTAAEAIANLVAPDRLSRGYIIPSVFEADVVRAVSEAIKRSEDGK